MILKKQSRSLLFDAVNQAAVEIITHERTMQKVGRESKFNLADYVQLRELID